MKKNTAKQLTLLIKKGVIIPDPSLVFIDSSVGLEKIAPGTTIHPFCRIYGAQTSIGPGCILGSEAPVTIDDCQLASAVKLNGGYFNGATFLDNSSMGSCAHVRPGTLVEEFASGAHAVGLKQTVLFPYVVLGSLINFCDCLMAGGTSRKNHSEVGSSYIHFNYTPHQDKATPSLIGDVPRGVLLDQPPVFLGGQSGLVGPAQIAFGAIIPAGIIIRKDILNPGLVANPEQSEAHSVYRNFPPQADPPTVDKMVGRDSLSRRSVRSDKAVRPYLTKVVPFTAGIYRSIDRIIRNNLVYIGNIYALHLWYRHARKIFMTKEKFQSACLAGALERLESILQERINRLGEIAEKMPRSIELNVKAGNAELPYLRQQKDFIVRWPKMKDELLQIAGFEGNPAKRDHLLAEITAGKKRSYPETIAALSTKGKTSAAEWLQSIVDRAAGIWKTDE